MSQFVRVFVGLALVVAMLASCVHTTPTPRSAKTGESILISFGAIYRDSDPSIALTPQDISVVLTDALSVPHTLLVESIFRAYPDHLSSISSGAATNLQSPFFKEYPFDGGWFAVVSLTDASHIALNIAPGAATIAVTVPGVQTQGSTYEGDLANLPLEVLDGIGTFDPDYVQQFSFYTAPSAPMRITPSGLGASDLVGAAKYVVNISNINTTVMSPLFASGDADIYVVPDTHNPYVQMNSHLVDNQDGAGTIEIYLLNPFGFEHNRQSNRRGANHQELKVRITLLGGENSWSGNEVFSLDPSSSYYDIDGNPIVGATPVLGQAQP